MKIQCDVCERAEAAVLCCADEAALCWDCDQKVHAANKLAGKHQRVPLLLPGGSASAASKMPICDICLEKAGYFFCLEDRALLCRNCDLTIHSASPFVSHHQRFLITGVRVALQQYLTNNSNTSSSRSSASSLASNLIDCNRKLLMASTSLVVEKTEGFKPHWPWSDTFEGADFDHCYGPSEPGSSS